MIITISCEVCRNAGVSDSWIHGLDVIRFKECLIDAYGHWIRVDGEVDMVTDLLATATVTERRPQFVYTWIDFEQYMHHSAY
jgi:hypothetical protein